MHLKQDTVFRKMKYEKTSDKDSGSPFGPTIIPIIKPACQNMSVQLIMYGAESFPRHFLLIKKPY